MSVLTVMKSIQHITVIASAVALIGACGEPLASADERVDANDTITASDIPPPTATMNCGRTVTTDMIGCTGSASNGVAPYTYQWHIVDDFGQGPGGYYWSNGTPSYSGYCPTGLYTYGTYYYRVIRFRVLDANNYSSNTLETTYVCWTPN